MTEILYNVAVLLLGVLIIFLLIEIIYWIVKFISDWILKRFARRYFLHFIPGKRRPLSYNKPGEVYGNWNGHKIRITYSYLSVGLLGHIHVYLWAENPSKSKLRISKISFFSRSKSKRYFHDEWDNKMLIESNPVAFGKTILKSTQIRKSIYESQRFRRPISPFMSIYKDGQVKISQIRVMVTSNRILKLLNVAKELAVATMGYSP